LIAGQRPGGMVSAGQALRRIAGPFGLLTGGATTGGLGQ
jgi:hypothetical protein